MVNSLIDINSRSTLFRLSRVPLESIYSLEIPDFIKQKIICIKNSYLNLILFTRIVTIYLKLYDIVQTNCNNQMEMIIWNIIISIRWEYLKSYECVLIIWSWLEYLIYNCVKNKQTITQKKNI